MALSSSSSRAPFGHAAALLLAAACSGGSASSSEATPVDTGDAGDAAPPVDETPDPVIVKRPYAVHVPPSYDRSKPLPLLLAFHGYGSGDNGALLEKYFKFDPVADSEGFLYVTPDGTKDESGQQFWNGTDACCNFYDAKVDDVAYVRAIVLDVATHYTLDSKRVFAIGLSGGGFMVHRLACDAADVFAAIVSQSGATWSDASKCAPKEPVVVVEIHGTKDAIVPYDGGTAAKTGLLADVPSAKDTIGHWATYNACTGTLADTTTTYDLFSYAGAETTVARYDCAHGAAELWTVPDGEHAPACAAGFAKTIWSFLAAHPKP